jgi:sn-1 stearoyl-lipid 9-desaturase
MDLLGFIALFVCFYFWHMMGITIGYHRLLAHRSFSCWKPVEYFWVLAGYLAWEASPIWWATMHRAHHRYTDSELDPHSPRNGGWMQAYFGWFTGTEYPDYISPQVMGKDLVKDPLYRFFEQGGNWHRGHYCSMIIGFAFRGILWLIFGWQVALASLFAGLVVQQVPLLLNVVCHLPKLGYKNYDTGDDSVNVWWVAMLTTGEGWHNNHHAFPGSARSGVKPWELDAAWVTIRLMKLLGLVTRVHEPSRLRFISSRQTS